MSLGKKRRLKAFCGEKREEPRGKELKMIVGSSVCYGSGLQGRQVYGGIESFSTAEANVNSLVYSISMLSDKVNQIQTLVNTAVLPDSRRQGYSGSSMAVASMSNLIQEIMLTASSMMFTCQKMANEAPNPCRRHEDQPQSDDGKVSDDKVADQVMQMEGDPVVEAFMDDDRLEGYFHINVGNHQSVERGESLHHGAEKIEFHHDRSMLNSDVIELDAADLLAKYTHYCQVCGKGFKRDANLRMHMRAHGDEYKSNAALSNPMKKSVSTSSNSAPYIYHADSPRKYSCPQEGCRWNKKHAKFQPLKSMICVKNHYKRSHCPKMYVCNRCNHKQFSLLSDLRTHEKHCGDLKWQCSCGTTFSRKDKLMGHVVLFVGHTPVANGYMDQGRQNHFA